MNPAGDRAQATRQAGKATVATNAISHQYRGADGNWIHALDRISLTVPDGSFASVIGASGCGKSTLLKIIGGLLQPTSGSRSVGGRVVTGPDADVGYMFQTATLLEWRTVLDNVLLPIEIRFGRSRARAARDRAVSLLEAADIHEFESAYPRELSGGMAQRAAICRMLITQPSLLLLDEPFGALDELTRESMNEELQRVCLSSGATAIMVTHSIPEAVFMSDIVFVMSPRPGRVTHVIEIDLPRPRTFDNIEGSMRYAQLVAEVRRALRPGREDEQSQDGGEA